MRKWPLAFGVALTLALAWTPLRSETVGNKLPTGWFAAGDNPADYEMGSDTSVVHTGKSSGYIRSAKSSPRGFGTLMQMFKADDYQGKRVRLSSYIKAEKVENWAGLWMRVDGPGGAMLGFDNMQNRAIKGTTDWRKYDVVLDVPATSQNIALGILLSGRGEAWIDDVQLEVVGKDVPTTNLKDMNSDLPRQPRNTGFEE